MKTLRCKRCGEAVEVPEQVISKLCQTCAEEAQAERELIEEIEEEGLPLQQAEQVYIELATDAGFRKSYLHHRAIEKAQRRQQHV